LLLVVAVVVGLEMVLVEVEEVAGINIIQLIRFQLRLTLYQLVVVLVPARQQDLLALILRSGPLEPHLGRSRLQEEEVVVVEIGPPLILARQVDQVVVVD
jgi:hypothetical protein